MKKVSIGDSAHEKAGLVKKSYEPGLFHLNEVTDDLIVEVVNLVRERNGEWVIRNGIFL